VNALTHRSSRRERQTYVKFCRSLRELSIPFGASPSSHRGLYACAVYDGSQIFYSPPTVISPISSVGDAVLPSLKLKSLPTALTLLRAFRTFPAIVIS